MERIRPIFYLGKSFNLQKQSSRGVLRKKCPEKRNKFTLEHPGQSVISVKLLATLLKSHLAWVLSCKFAAYFQNTFSSENLWRATSQFKTGNYSRN